MKKISIEDADRVLRADYWDDVRSMAEDCLDAVKRGDVSDETKLADYLAESVDGCARVIYTHKALRVLCYTENDSAYEEYGALEDVAQGEGGWFGMVSRMAYFAMMSDVRGMPEWDEAVEALEALADA